MSKQINFYMDKLTEKEFIQFVLDNGFVFINWSNGSIVNPYTENSLFMFITKEEYLPFLKYRHNYVDVLNCLVIEYIRNNIIDEKRIITRGRIYISDAYKEKQFSLYMDDFAKGYSLLYKWIKKNVPYQNISNMGEVYKAYINDSMLLYSEKEYHFQT